jgi:DNA primase
MQQLLTDSTLCDWLPEQVTVIDNPDLVPDVAVQIRELAARTDGTFLFYFVGHGTLSEHGELYFPLSGTNADHVDLTGMPYAHVRNALMASRARVKISILDCCYSGRAIQALSVQAHELALAADVRGAYIWTAAEGPAHVVPLEQQASACTSFTGELISLVREGLPNGPPLLTLDDLYHPLRQRMRARGLPLSRRVAEDTASSALFARNIATRAAPAKFGGSGQARRSEPARSESPHVIDRRNVGALKAAVPLKDVITDYVALRGSGRELRGSCPFCGGNSGQFSVNSYKGVYHCFECQAGGDALKFIMQMEHLTFGEAIDRLASRGGITLRADAGHEDHQHVERIRLVEAHEAAAQFYIEQLNTNPEASLGRTFLTERGFDQNAATRFGVGYSPQGWDRLTCHLRGKGFTNKELLLSGLAQEGRRGPIDRFRGRLMWPIRNIGGEAVGFAARKLREADNGPTHIHTPDTAIYKKSQVLFGIDLANREIAKSNGAVVAEDFTDVMACHLAGITTAVSPCGTVFGGDHIKIMRRLLKDNGSARVVFTFDHDAVGHEAALRTFADDQAFAAQSYIAVAPDGTGLNELRLAKGDAAVADLVEPRTSLIKFTLRQIIARYDLETPAGRTAALEAAAPVVARIKGAMTRRELAVELADMLGELSVMSVIRHLQALPHRFHDGESPAPTREHLQTHMSAQAPPIATLNLRNPVYATERELLKIALQRPELVSPAFDAYGVDEFTAPPYAAVRQAIMEAGGAEYGVQAPQKYLALVREAALDGTVRVLVSELAVEAIMRRTVDETYAGEQLVAVRRRSVDRRMREVQDALAHAGAEDDAPQLAAVQNELWTLQQYGQALRERGAEAL